MKSINSRLSKIIVSLLIAGLLSGFYQISTEWQPIRQIPNYSEIARAPLLVPDLDNNIHVFNYEEIGDLENAILYRKWNPNEGWSPPVDIILAGLGGGPQTLQAAFLDSSDYIHILYYIGTDTSGEIFHTKAHITEVNNASKWQISKIIARNADPLPFITATQQQNGRILVFYGGDEFGTGLYLITSEDQGQTWGSPLALSLVSIENQWPASIQAIVDKENRVHVSWSQVSTEGVGETVYYGRMNEKLTAFETERVIARREGDDYSANWPTLMDTGSQLLLIYMDDFPATRWMRTSQDYGDTWSIPVRPFPEVGEYEYAILCKDSSNNLHMILGNRTVEPEIHGMWYSRWVGNRWSALEPIVSGPVTESFDPSAPQAVIAQGNLIFATWWNNVRRTNLTGAWYSYKQLDTAPYDTVDYSPPLPEIINLQETEISIQNDQITDENGISPHTYSTEYSSYAPAAPVFLALIPVGILLFIFFFIVHRRKR